MSVAAKEGGVVPESATVLGSPNRPVWLTGLVHLLSFSCLDRPDLCSSQ